MEAATKTYYDTKKNVYKVYEAVMAEGGQGVIYKTVDEKLLVKISKATMTAEEYKESIYDVVCLDVDMRVLRAMPMAMLDKSNGYVMEFFKDSIPFSKLFFSKANDPYRAFCDRGGLKRHLLLLQDLVKSLGLLARSNIVYCDLSCNNIFVSKNAIYDAENNAQQYSDSDITRDNTKIYLIDTDNMQYESVLKSNNRGCLYTPGVQPPEFALPNQTNTCSSDLFSFAMFAFSTLNFYMPFDAEEEDNWDDTVEGGGDSSIFDIFNSTFLLSEESIGSFQKENIVPYKLHMTNEILGLFRRVFGDVSIDKFTNRPSHMQWFIAFDNALDKLYYCEKCNTFHFYDAVPRGCRYSGLIAQVDSVKNICDELISNGSHDVVINNHVAITDKNNIKYNYEHKNMLDISYTKGIVSYSAAEGYDVIVLDENMEQVAAKFDSNIHKLAVSKHGAGQYSYIVDIKGAL